MTCEEGNWKESRKKRGHHEWRERNHHYGEMIKIDGSQNDLFVNRG